MSSVFQEFGPNSGFVQELYELYLTDPTLVEERWARYFKSLGSLQVTQAHPSSHVNGQSHLNGHGASGTGISHAKKGSTPSVADMATQLKVYDLIQAYRNVGHFKARLNPLSSVAKPPLPRELDLESYGFSPSDLASKFLCRGLMGRESMPLESILSTLERTYADAVGVEYQHLVRSEEREWLQEQVEARPDSELSNEIRSRAFGKLVAAVGIEAQLHKKYVGQKWFSLEGGEALIAMVDRMLVVGKAQQVDEVVMGIAHRGRISLLNNILGKSLSDLFTEFEDQALYSAIGSGDVKYHKGYLSQYPVSATDSVTVRLSPNPSHLEFVDPVVEGMVRARQDALQDHSRSRVVPLLMHGEAAFCGQGVVYETINFARTAGYWTGGTVHIAINNQVGFTTDPKEYRSSFYCTDLAKGIDSPVFHVNGEDVDACLWVMQVALEYRMKFHKDVFIDLVCFRRFGHNEADDPSFTQPRMYSEIKGKKNIAQIYAEKLVDSRVISESEVQEQFKEYEQHFHESYEKRKIPVYGEASALYGRLRSPRPKTSVEQETLRQVAQTLTAFPAGFKPHPKLVGILEKRVQTFHDGSAIDWGLAEALAYGSLVAEGRHVRLSGQDCGRGTFSHRHLQLTDYETGDRYLPLNQLSSENARFEVYNSTLSEAGIMGFEYGYSVLAPQSLVMWEGQFGDFVNGAQVNIDQFLASSECKWDQLSGLVLLLPHAYEGQGSEHSSARLERFLQLSAEENWRVCYPTSSSQIFHLLREQCLTEIKRPLIVMSPKSLLRSPDAASPIGQFTSGEFRSLIVDTVGKKTPERAIILSGKVGYDVLAGLRKENSSALVIRMEQLYPFPTQELKEALSGIKTKQVAWVQEEPKNMGAWSYVEPLLREELKLQPRFIGRTASPNPATGSSKRHVFEQQHIVAQAVAFANGELGDGPSAKKP